MWREDPFAVVSFRFPELWLKPNEQAQGNAPEVSVYSRKYCKGRQSTVRWFLCAQSSASIPQKQLSARSWDSQMNTLTSAWPGRNMSVDAKAVQSDGCLRRSRHSFRWAWWYMPLKDLSTQGPEAGGSLRVLQCVVQANQSYVVRPCAFDYLFCFCS